MSNNDAFGLLGNLCSTPELDVVDDQHQLGKGGDTTPMMLGVLRQSEGRYIPFDRKHPRVPDT